MKYIYVLVPLMQIQESLDPVVEVQKILHLSKQQFMIDEIHDCNMAVHIKNFQLGFLEIQEILKEYQNHQHKIQLYEQILKEYKPEQLLKQSIHEISNIESLIRKAKRAKQLKQQNKKLKNLMQLQLENTQKVRQQTQKTMKTLKEQFDALVEEMGRREKKQNGHKYQKREVHNKEKQKKNHHLTVRKQLHF